MSTAVCVDTLLECSWAAGDPRHPRAIYDFKTKHGGWADGCHKHYHEHRLYEDLGTGKGQKLFLAVPSIGNPRPRPAHLARLQDLLKEHGTIEAVLEATGGEW